MKHSLILTLPLLFLFILSASGQEKKVISLPEAATRAIEQSTVSKLADTRVESAENELSITKSEQYPNLSLSGQYLWLSHANVNLQVSNGSGGEDTGGNNGSSPEVNQLLLGQANASMPLFSGFRLKNSLQADQNHLMATRMGSQNDKEEVTLQAITDYVELYKAQQRVDLIREDLKTARQRVSAFQAKEANGILGRNDLLKAQLHESRVLLALEEAEKTRDNLNRELIVLLQLPGGQEIATDSTSVLQMAGIGSRDSLDRKDLLSLEYEQRAAEDRVKSEQAAFYPSLTLTGGYIALDLHNALTVTNALTAGVGVSYDLAGIFKSGNKVRLARSRAKELEYQQQELREQIGLQLASARQEYELAQRKLEVYKKSREQAQENYRIVKDKYDNGLSDTNDLLEADLEQLQSQIDLSNARADLSLKYYELMGTEGVLSSLFVTD